MITGLCSFYTLQLSAGTATLGMAYMPILWYDGLGSEDRSGNQVPTQWLWEEEAAELPTSEQ